MQCSSRLWDISILQIWLVEYSHRVLSHTGAYWQIHPVKQTPKDMMPSRSQSELLSPHPVYLVDQPAVLLTPWLFKGAWVVAKESTVDVQSLSRVRLFVTVWTAAHQASLSLTVSWNLLRLMSIELVMSSNHLILCHPLLLLPSVFPSQEACYSLILSLFLGASIVLAFQFFTPMWWLSSLQQQSYLSSLLLPFNPISPPPHSRPPLPAEGIFPWAQPLCSSTFRW